MIRSKRIAKRLDQKLRCKGARSELAGAGDVTSSPTQRGEGSLLHYLRGRKEAVPRISTPSKVKTCHLDEKQNEKERMNTSGGGGASRAPHWS